MIRYTWECASLHELLTCLYGVHLCKETRGCGWPRQTMRRPLSLFIPIERLLMLFSEPTHPR